MRKMLLPFFLSAALLTSACNGGLVGTIATETTTQTSTQVSTYAEAVIAARLATDTVDLYVNAAKPNQATLLELQRLNNAVHAEFLKLQAAQMAGQSLVMAAFNSAFGSFINYSRSKGVAS